jgi:CheY-like chemotaxis protein/anti-sigma regulatory factor (Ser/Thr protein kinase)
LSACSANLPLARGVESEIREALINLIFNAVDAMPSGGTVTLRTAKGTPNLAGQPTVDIEVVDTGLGMDAETRRRCLEPFFTTKGERGSGLGLAMVYGIVQRHGGNIAIESELGAGTTVRLTFAAATGTEVNAEIAEEQSVARSLRILVVDDDTVVLKSIRDMLESDEHAVVAVEEGQQAIQTFMSALAVLPFEVVMTDLGMPHVDGRQVAAAVKAASPDTPVIMLTGWGRLMTDAEMPPHVDRLLSKPPNQRELQAVLASLSRAPREPIARAAAER